MIWFVSIMGITGWVLAVTKRQALGGALIFLANAVDAAQEVIGHRWGWLTLNVFLCGIAAGLIIDALRRPGDES